MILSNPPKALIVLVAIICITVLMAVGKIEESAGTGLIGSIVGYGIGNGIRGTSETPPIISRKK